MNIKSSPSLKPLPPTVSTPSLKGTSAMMKTFQLCMVTPHFPLHVQQKKKKKIIRKMPQTQAFENPKERELKRCGSSPFAPDLSSHSLPNTR